MEEKIEVVETSENNVQKEKKINTFLRIIVYVVVIAVLAVILVPTYKTLYKKIIIREDVALAKKLNIALVEYEANNEITSFEDAVKAIRRGGYIFIGLDAQNEGCYFVWDAKTNQVLLVEEVDGSYDILYNEKDDYGDPETTWYFAITEKN